MFILTSTAQTPPRRFITVYINQTKPPDYAQPNHNTHTRCPQLVQICPQLVQLVHMSTIISRTAGPQWFVKYLTAYVLSQFIYDPVLVKLKLNVVALSSVFLLLMSLFFNDDPYISTYVFTSSKELDPITSFNAWLRI